MREHAYGIAESAMWPLSVVCAALDPTIPIQTRHMSLIR